MTKPRSFHFLSLLILFLLLPALACGGDAADEEGDEATQPPAATEAVPPTTTPEPEPADTAVPAPTQPSDENANSSGTEFTNAFNRATTMMSQNGKPTPIPFGNSGGKEDDTANPPPTNTPLPPPTQAPESNLAGIEIDNFSSASICFVYISTPNSDTWGEDQLGSDEVIESGYYRIFELTPGTYDIRLDDCYSKVVDVQLELEVSELTVVNVEDATLPKEGDAPVTLVNDLDSDACYVFISPSDSTEWGDDWLGTGVIVPPDYQYFFNVPQGTFDMSALDCNFETLNEVYGVELTSDGYAWALSGKVSDIATLEIINEGNTPICYLQISLTTATEWGADWLGSEEVISEGDSRQFEMNPDAYDIRALDCDQETIKEEYGIDVQGSTTWTVP